MHRRVVVIGASAGGIEALRLIAGSLPQTFDAAICVVLHTAPESPGILPEILARSGPLASVSPTDGQRLQAGRIYVAPPDRHLVLEPDRMRVTKGPKENRFRPAIDPLFRSAAQVYGPAAIGVILTGNLDDGAAGLWAIKQLGGVAIVQSPGDALYPSMPRNALRQVQADHVLALHDIGPLLVSLTAEPIDAHERSTVPDHMNVEVNIAKGEPGIDAGLEDIAKPSAYACPECHGVLLKIEQEGRVRFRCHTGHAYSAHSLLAAVSEGIDRSLWNSIRCLEEGSLLLRHLSEHLALGLDEVDAQRLTFAAQEARAHADVIRQLAKKAEPGDANPD
jgi:two-component system chemotaxis response regulator CheB